MIRDSAAVLLILLCVFACKTRDVADVPTDAASQVQMADAVSLPQDQSAGAIPSAVGKPVSRDAVQPSNLDCSVTFQCPPVVKPVRCKAHEIGGSRTFQVRSAPNHCMGISRLFALICADGRKLSDFDTDCQPKSQ